jgi:acetylornithine deacetylase/succinyl-diaminopimelate desuccinylase-like protein
MKPRFALLALVAAGAAFAQVPTVDWNQQQAELLRHYRAIVQLDTSNPPGNETRVAEYLKKVFEAEGIPAQTYALDASRANVVARIKGNGKKRPMLILAHEDVVNVSRDKWPVDPFGAIMKDGYIWGRGTRDDKDHVAANLMVMLLAKRGNIKLDRDIIFLAEAGEESATEWGIDYMVRDHFPEIDAEFAITEGGGARVENGRVTTVSIGTSEKVPRRARLVATGVAGHGSVPRMDNSVVHLGAAVGKIGMWETPMRLNDTTRAYFERLATISPPDKAARYNALLNPQAAAEAQRYLRAREPGMYSMLRTSVVPTMLKGGIGQNVIPSEVEATLDIRALPDEDMNKFYAEMQRVIDDPAVKVVPIPNPRPATPPSRLDTEMFRVLEQVSKRMYPGATVLPSMSTGASDKAQLRFKGVQSYGIGPAVSEDESAYGGHTDVERLPESALYKFAEFTWNAVMEVAAAK